MPEIIRFEDEECDGLYIRYIYGLPLFHANNVDDVEDPVTTFYRFLVMTYPCAAQIGLRALQGDDPNVYFAPLREGKDFIINHVNLSSHGGCWIEPNPAGCFFPHLPEKYFEITDEIDDTLVSETLLYEDQPFLYVNATGVALDQLAILSAQPPFPTCEDLREDWWPAITEFVPVGLWGGYDEGRIFAYTRNPESFQLIDAVLGKVCDIIRATPWFQEHQQELHWPTAEEEEHLCCWCLMHPEQIEAERKMHLGG